jgi:hypothetical protein
MVPSEPACTVSVQPPVNVIVVDPLNPVPVIATVVPGGPEVGVNVNPVVCAFAIGVNDVSGANTPRTSNPNSIATNGCLKLI